MKRLGAPRKQLCLVEISQVESLQVGVVCACGHACAYMQAEVMCARVNLHAHTSLSAPPTAAASVSVEEVVA